MTHNVAQDALVAASRPSSLTRVDRPAHAALHRNRWRNEAAQVDVARDDQVGLRGDRRRGEVVVVRVRGHGGRVVVIRKDERVRGDSVDVRTHVGLSERCAELRPAQDALELLEQVRRDDEIELPVSPAVDDDARSA